MTIEAGKEYKVYYAGKSRNAKIVKLLKDRYGSFSVVWKYYAPWPLGWSDENIDSAEEFKRILGDPVEKIEI